MFAGEQSDKGGVDELTKEFVAESQEGLERMELCLTQLEKRPGDGELVAEIFRTVHTIKGTTSFLDFGRLQTLAHTGESLLGALRDGTITVNSALIDGLLKLMDGLRRILTLIESTGTEGVRSTDDDIELILLLTRLKTPDTPVAGKCSAADGQSHSANTIKLTGPPLSPTAPSTATTVPSRTLRIDVEVLNQLMNTVGELVLTRNQILQCTPGMEGFPELTRRLSNVTSALSESVRQARMQPLGQLFAKFPRMVRDLAQACERRVQIEFEGQETRLDKSLLDAIRDPLTHAVRNSVDHGIEPPEERVKMGKPAEGLVRLRAFQQSGSVVIEVIDDGAGIDARCVLAKAIERGLVTPDQAAAMTPGEVLKIIFMPGFSTTSEVTRISGRGVGMDIVRAKVEEVCGSVQIESSVGFGTTVRLRVPLTLAIVPALIVRSGEQNFALPQSALVELAYVSERDAASAVERIGDSKLYRIHGRLLPLVWLDRVLGLRSLVSDHSTGFYIAVLETEGRRFGLVLDHLKAPEEIVVKPLSPVLREIGMYSGGTMLANGTLALILDVAAIAVLAGVRQEAEPAAATAEAESAQGQDANPGMEDSMVVYQAGKSGSAELRHGARMAIPLSAVERIERIPLDTIEWVGERAMLQYSGELLSLEDEDGILHEMEIGSPGLKDRRAIAHVSRNDAGEHEGEGRTATVMICLRTIDHRQRRVGIVVRRVLDISPRTSLPIAEGIGDEQLTVVQNRVTAIHREFLAPPAVPSPGLLQEVA